MPHFPGLTGLGRKEDSLSAEAFAESEATVSSAGLSGFAESHGATHAGPEHAGAISHRTFLKRGGETITTLKVERPLF